MCSNMSLFAFPLGISWEKYETFAFNYYLLNSESVNHFVVIGQYEPWPDLK